MKHIKFILALLPLLIVGCSPTRIVTYSPAPSSTYYSTTVTPYRTGVTTTIAQVYNPAEDMSLFLDLQAVAALFAQSNTVREFELLLNSTTYPVSNLDLNGDGYIDYLRVYETFQGFNHVFLIQAVLGMNIFQDVATIVVERPGFADYYVEVIGAPFIYGPKYIVRPIFFERPLIFVHLGRTGYSPWRSPWYWDHFPSHYHHHAPVFLNHYQAYIATFMGGHRYCHEVHYPKAPHFNDYDRMTREYQRNDFGAKNPEKSFTVRNANAPAGTARANNAYDIRQMNEATKVTTTRSASTNSSASRSTSISKSNTGSSSRSSSSSSASSSRSSSSSSSSASRSSSSSSTSSASRGSASSSRSSSSSATSPSRSSSSSSSSASRGSANSSRSSSASVGDKTVTSRVSSSGSSSTSVRSNSSPSRSSSSSSSSASRSSSTSSNSSRSSSSSTSRR